MISPEETRLARELFERLFAELSAIGRDQRGATTRLAWSTEAASAREWFARTAAELGLAAETDRNGNLWAWAQGAAEAAGARAGATAGAAGATAGARPATNPTRATDPGPATDPTRAIVTGSHLDSVRDGGSYDGALGVVSALVAVHLLNRRGPLPAPLAVVSFADEEGGRFNTPTFGSRAMLGTLDVQETLDRRDGDGMTLRGALEAAGIDPGAMGPDPERLERIAALVELHIEQDTLLTTRELPLALGTQILPHGRWRVDLLGEANHAGTTPLGIRRDPMTTLAAAITAARSAAVKERALATIGRLEVSPNATNAIAERVTLWLDVRAEGEATIERTVKRILDATRAAAAAEGIGVEMSRESFTGAVTFSPSLRARVAAILAAHGIEDVPMVTGAGHDSGALADALPTAMLFVRSATGASHSPRELASVDDCLAGIGALTAVLAALANDTARVGDDG